MMILVHRVSENIGSIGAKCPAFRAMSWKTTSGRVLLGVIFGVLGSATEGQGGLTNDPSSLNMLKIEYIFPSSWNAICVYFCCTKAMGKLLQKQRLRRHRSKSMSSRCLIWDLFDGKCIFAFSLLRYMVFPKQFATQVMFGGGKRWLPKTPLSMQTEYSMFTQHWKPI